MYSICIVTAYFGKLPSNFNLWTLSCSYNPSIDFLVVTDQKVEESLTNLKVLNMTFEEFKALVDEKIGFDTALTTPYKCCDFKPTYGHVLEKHLDVYDFWGHCDIDLIFGDLREFFTTEKLRSFDKIYEWGHLSIHSRKAKYNYKIDNDYKTVFSNPTNVAFDEKFGLVQKYLSMEIPIYAKRDFADIHSIFHRFKIIGCDNYKEQVFSWREGKVYRYFCLGGRINKEEFAYIHFQKRELPNNIYDTKNLKSFFITNKGFFISSLEDGCTIRDIEQYNKYPGYIVELLESARHLANLYIKAATRRVKRIFK